MLPLKTLQFLCVHIVQKKAATITLRTCFLHLSPTAEQIADQISCVKLTFFGHQSTQTAKRAQTTFVVKQRAKIWFVLSVADKHNGQSSDCRPTPLLRTFIIVAILS